jgi:hypothetical protein
MMDPEWRVKIVPDVTGRYDTILIGRDRGEQVDYVTKLGGGDTEVTSVDAIMVPPSEASIQIPFGVLQAIAKHLRPDPGSAEVKRLEESLAVERARVDKMIDRHLRGPLG